MTKKFLLFFLFSLASTLYMNAQDTIRFRDGSVQNARILEVNSTSVKYKKAENPNGPTFSVPPSQLSTIIYRNGTKEVFGPPVAPPVAFPVYKPETTYKEPVVTPPTGPTPIKFSGPRVGCTYVGEGTAAKYITDKGKTPFVSQFGWQLETRIFTSSQGISGLVELVGLIGGLEQGMVLPSASLMFGMRGREGLELALGPNVSLTGLGMAFAVGTSFHLDDVYFPVNIAFVPSVTNTETKVNYNGVVTKVKTHTGFRVSLLIGFNTRKR